MLAKTFSGSFVLEVSTETMRCASTQKCSDLVGTVGTVGTIVGTRVGGLRW